MKFAVLLVASAMLFSGCLSYSDNPKGLDVDKGIDLTTKGAEVTCDFRAHSRGEQITVEFLDCTTPKLLDNKPDEVIVDWINAETGATFKRTDTIGLAVYFPDSGNSAYTFTKYSAGRPEDRDFSATIQFPLVDGEGKYHLAAQLGGHKDNIPFFGPNGEDISSEASKEMIIKQGVF
ncbi:MAG: hypothetical protein ACPHK8_05160 [Thermoplasmatota archaeon]